MIAKEIKEEIENKESGNYCVNYECDENCTQCPRAVQELCSGPQTNPCRCRDCAPKETA